MNHPIDAPEAVRYYLGIDGGQSGTKGLLSDQRGRVLGAGQGGPCNHVTAGEGRAKFFAAVGSVLDQACQAAGLDPSSVEFASVCCGFSGGAEDKESYSRDLIRSRKYKITHDAEIALSGATEGQPGIVIIAGTGSMGFGRDAAGHTARAGGWGYIFGDEGGGFDLTRQALRSALRHEEGWGVPSALRDRLLAATGAVTVNQLLHRFYTPEFPRPAVAALSSLVSDAAEGGDEEAQRILFDAASQLVTYVEGVHRVIFRPMQAVPIAYIGGVFKSRLLLEEFVKTIRYRLACRVVSPKMSPAAGALLEALRADGNSSTVSNLPEFEK
ncbi:MAG: BadF/BadG/BcrA/BcrD ATPase family protein [Bryobacteraceae bacterium]